MDSSKTPSKENLDVDNLLVDKATKMEEGNLHEAATSPPLKRILR
jgi:hypothetical protein